MASKRKRVVVDPHPFLVSGFYEQGIDGYAVNVSVRERIEGTDQVRLLDGFTFDLNALPAIRASLQRLYRKAKRRGHLTHDDRGHLHAQEPAHD